MILYGETPNIGLVEPQNDKKILKIRKKKII
jgi:hypothetical protein